jgi:transposase-like protein
MTKPRRKYTPEFKVRVALELISGQKTLMEASREYHIKDTVISRWKMELLERAPSLFTENTQNEHGTQKRIAELERMVGRLTMELEMAKKVYGYSASESSGSVKS